MMAASEVSAHWSVGRVQKAKSNGANTFAKKFNGSKLGCGQALHLAAWTMLPGFSANILATVVGLGAAAISLFAAWIMTVPQGQLSVWVRPALIVGASLFFVLALATAVSGLRAWRRYPATIVVVEGRREVIIGFWDAVDLIQKRTRYGEDGWVRFTEEEYLQVVRERLLSDFKEGYVALFGRLPHASAYRRIDRPEFADMYFDEDKAILYKDEAKTRPHRVKVAASYRHVKQCIQRIRGKSTVATF